MRLNSIAFISDQEGKFQAIGSAEQFVLLHLAPEGDRADTQRGGSLPPITLVFFEGSLNELSFVCAEIQRLSRE